MYTCIDATIIPVIPTIGYLNEISLPSKKMYFEGMKINIRNNQRYLRIYRDVSTPPDKVWRFDTIAIRNTSIYHMPVLLTLISSWIKLRLLVGPTKCLVMDKICFGSDVAEFYISNFWDSLRLYIESNHVCSILLCCDGISEQHVPHIVKTLCSLKKFGVATIHDNNLTREQKTIICDECARKNISVKFKELIHN